MATTDELLEQGARMLMDKPETEEDYLNIDWESRIITIPSNLTNIGVYNDKDTNRLYFRCPIEYGEFKIADFGIHVNYQNTGASNTKHDGDIYFVDDVESDGSYLTFSWLVGRHAYLERGTTAFIICCKVVDSDNNVVNELNTTVATLSVLEGLEVDVLPPEDYPDYLEELLRRIEDVEESALTGVKVNGEEVPVTDHVAEIEIEKGGGSNIYVYEIEINDTISSGDGDTRKSFSIVVPESYGTPVAIIGFWMQADRSIEAVIGSPQINGNTVTGSVVFQNMDSSRTITVTSATISILTE